MNSIERMRLMIVIGVFGPASTAFPQVNDGEAISKYAIDEIVVTAQKRAQNVQDVPISMNVVSQQQLEDFNISTIESLQSWIPNLFISKTNANNGMYLRGFGSAPNNPGFDQTVSVYIDGIYAGRSRQLMAPFFDVQRIEVLRGPQGALLGKNTAAGAISFITADPTQEFEGSASLSYNFDRPGTNLHGFLSGPISETVSARIAMQYNKLDGYIHNIATGQDDNEVDEKGIRLTLKYEPSDAISVIGKMQYDDFQMDGNSSTHYSPPTLPIGDALPDAIKNKDTVGAFGVRAFDAQDGFNASLTANFALAGDYTITSITGYSSFTSHRLGPPGYDDADSNFRAEYHEDFDQISQEVRLVSPTGRTVDFIVGAYADDADYSMLNFSQYELFFSEGLTEINFDQSSKTFSAYVNATWNVSDSVKLIGSGRYTDNEKNGNYVSTVTGMPLAPSQSARTLPPDTIDETHFDPSITAQYFFASGGMVYASYSEGSKSGAFEVLSRGVLPESFKTEAEEATNYEVGIKISPWESVNLSLSAFILEFDNLQVSAYDLDLLQSVTKNAASARSEGVEGTISMQLSEHILVNGAISYVDAKYTDFPGATCTFLQPSPPCETPTNNIKGYRIPFSAKWSGFVRGSYIRPIGQSLQYGVIGVVAFRSDYYIDQGGYNPNYGLQEAYQKYDVRLELGDQEGQWSVALIGRNLSDEITGTQSYLWPLQPPASAAIGGVDEPRSIALQANFWFH
jgi:iron complex outermembrane receptor protein